MQEVQSARETADETVSHLEAELDTAKAAQDAAAAKLQVGPDMYQFRCKSTNGRAMAVSSAAATRVHLLYSPAPSLQSNYIAGPDCTISVSIKAAPSFVCVHCQQELAKAANAAEALSAEVERLEAELHSATAAADSMV